MQKPNPTVTNAVGRTVVVMDWTDPKVIARVASKTDKSGGPDACWPWLGGLDRKGYGIFYTSARTSVMAHRAAWAVSNGREPDESLVTDHLCRNHGCVNPQHLELVTNRENVLRGEARALKETCAKGHPWVEGSFGWAKRKGDTPRRYCIPCQREANERSYLKRKERHAQRQETLTLLDLLGEEHG